MKSFLRIVALACGVASLPLAVDAFTVVHDGNTLIENVARDSLPSPESQHTSRINPSVPLVDTFASVDGASRAETSVQLTNAGFVLAFDHARNGLDGSYARSRGHVRFTVDAPVHYAASGFYTATDPLGQGVELTVALEDLGAGDLFRSSQISSATVDESFVLGGTDGDTTAIFEGSLDGLLLPGELYYFSYRVTVEGNDPLGTSLPGATATGNVSLVFSAVPEPGTSVLLGLGLAAMCCFGRRERRAA